MRTSKACTVCGEEKPLEDFFKCKAVADGRMAKCKTCKTKQIYEWREKNRDRLNKYQRDYNKKPNAKETTRKYNQTDKAKQSARDSDSKRSAAKKKERENNREKWRVYSRNKHAKRKAQSKTDPGIRPSEWTAIKESFNGACAYCGAKQKMTMDHFIPLSRGGAHSPHNIVPACSGCNTSKHAMDPFVFIWWRKNKGGRRAAAGR